MSGFVGNSMEVFNICTHMPARIFPFMDMSPVILRLRLGTFRKLFVTFCDAPRGQQRCSAHLLFTLKSTCEDLMNGTSDFTNLEAERALSNILDLAAVVMMECTAHSLMRGEMLLDSLEFLARKRP